MRPVGYGRPNTPVIPEDWQATHAAVIDDTLDCLVTIGPAGTRRVWNEGAGQTDSQPAPLVYDGVASVTPLDSDTLQPTVAADVVPVRRYEVKLTHPAQVQVGHVVNVVASPDVDLVSKRLTVTGIERASRRFSRVLHAVLTD